MTEKAKWSEPNDWTDWSFQLSVDEPVDWTKFDLVKWQRNVAQYTALLMARTVDKDREVDADHPIRAVIMGAKVFPIKYATDAALNKLLDEETKPDTESE